MRVLLSSVFIVSTFLFGCTPDEPQTDPGVEEAVSAPRYQVFPNLGGRGTSLEVRIEATRSVFEFGATEIDLGPGITVDSVTVQDGYTAVAQIGVDAEADIGARDVTVTVEGAAAIVAGAFSVIAESIRIDPATAKMGETLQVAVVGTGTEWMAGYSWPGFGDDIRIMDFQVLSETLGVAQIAISPNARPGPRDVSIEDGPRVVTLYNGFTIDRAAITATFEPTEAYQGKSVEFTVRGLRTDFAEGTTLEFWDNSGLNADIQTTQMTVLDSENLFGRMRLSNAARIGMRDVVIRYEGESLLIPDAFEVKDSPPDLSDVYVGTGFDVTRVIVNETGELLQDVSAYAYFVIPLDPPCGAASPMGDGPKPYDANGVFPVPPPAPEVDCPNPETVSAGDFVWFEGPENVVTLEKAVIESTGQIIYVGNDLTLDDYHFGTTYALHTQGDPDGIPEVTVPDVQPTVPGDYYLSSPDLSRNFTWNRAEDFTYTWTPALTYPDAVFSTGISGTLVSSGEGGFAGSVPWDDGVHTYTAAELSQLQASQVGFSASSVIEGREFGLPFSTIQYCKSDSTLSTSATMFLE